MHILGNLKVDGKILVKRAAPVDDCDCGEFDDEDCVEIGNCTRDQAYWKALPVANYPASAFPMLIGGVSYSAAQVKTLLNSNVNSLTVRVQQAVATTNLNIASGADQSEIAATLVAANTWLSNNPKPGNVGQPLLDKLDSYNSGCIGPGSCGSNPDQRYVDISCLKCNPDCDEC